jgi:hypothetical protein
MTLIVYQECLLRTRITQCHQGCNHRLKAPATIYLGVGQIPGHSIATPVLHPDPNQSSMADESNNSAREKSAPPPPGSVLAKKALLPELPAPTIELGSGKAIV